MLRRLYNAKGVLLSPLLGPANRMQVDLELRSLLGTLASGDWTYLALTDGVRVEVVKVVWIDAQGIYIERGKDFTTPLEFDAGALVEYTLTREEILDSYSGQFQLFYGGAVQISGTKVTYPEVQFEIFGAGVLVGDDGKYVIGRKEDAYGCCNGNNLPAPIIPPYIYITSRPYPVEELDAISASLYSILHGQFVNREVDDTVISELAILEGDIWGGLTSYTQPPDDTVVSELAVLEGDIWGGLITYTQPPDDIVKTALHLVSGDIWGGLIEYTHPPENPLEDHIETALAIVSGSIT